ncbi:MAG: hypothetical protein ACOCRZ_07650 [Halothermotrichaceae bacterium]
MSIIRRMKVNVKEIVEKIQVSFTMNEHLKKLWPRSNNKKLVNKILFERRGTKRV